MSKINVKMILKTSDEIYEYVGKGIKKDNKIIFNDEGVKTIITLGDAVYLERKSDYYIKLGFCINKNMHTTYNSPEGCMDIYTDTYLVKKENDMINIRYKEYIGEMFIGDFDLFFKFGIDSLK